MARLSQINEYRYIHVDPARLPALVHIGGSRDEPSRFQFLCPYGDCSIQESTDMKLKSHMRKCSQATSETLHDDEWKPVADQIKESATDAHDKPAPDDDGQPSPGTHQKRPTATGVTVVEPLAGKKWTKKKKKRRRRANRALDLASQPQVAAVDMHSDHAAVYITYAFQNPTDFERQTLMSIPVVGNVPNLPMSRTFGLGTAASSTVDTPQQTSSGSDSGGYYYREDLTLIDLTPTGTDPLMSDETPSDKTLLRLYGQLSNKDLHAIYPKVWSKNGLWKKGYRHLENKRPKHDKTIQEKEGLKWCILFEKVFQCSVVTAMPGWTRIVLGIVRSSSNPLNYGLDGMRQRATVAARAWMKLYPQPSLLVVNARSKVSSRLSLADASFAESLRLLEAVNQIPGTIVQLLIVGIDGFTTDVQNLLWLKNQFPGLNIKLIFVVPDFFPEVESTFPKLDNGIRYGQFHLDDVVTVVQRSGTQGGSASKHLAELLDHINQSKAHNVAGDMFLHWTKQRAHFRVCPDSLTDSGVGVPLGEQ
ncbi:hypothetical protein CEP54_004286 [Fusarium duplospermum]|uniref:Uncharacterized protein n=1 Tax=Fusarium duplospermum TaxID=1325734 RepID=A0A428QJD8_9HYPO|nr:hypothetical protein CEP54_004286 [Fusarium duplospermum]